MMAQQDAKKIMHVISRRTKVFLQTEIHLTVEQIQFYQSHVTALKLDI